MSERIKGIAVCALFVALNAVLSQVAIPIGPVPVNLTHISVFMAGALLGARRGALAQTVYILLGAAGLPVFSRFSGGMAVVFGPTGGFLAGYVGCAFVTGLLAAPDSRGVKPLIPAMLAGWVVTYVCGLFWFICVTGYSLAAALPVCMFPFLPGDAAKTALSVVMIRRLWYAAVR